MFSGRNPLRRANDLLDPVKIENFAIEHGSLSNTIKGIVDRMLAFNPHDRPSIPELLELWEGPFLQAVDLSHDLQGSIF